MDQPDAASPAGPAVPPLVRTRLSVMMFLQYAIWGAWLPILWPFLAGYRQFEAGQIANMFAVGAVGAIIAPFVAGQIADRYFATEKFLAISHVLGAVLIWFLASISTYYGFLVFSLLYSIVYAPTLALTNSISFHHLPDRDRDFGKVRLWGTIGWIAVGIGMGQWLLNVHSTPQREVAMSIVTEEFGTSDSRQALLESVRVETAEGVIVGPLRAETSDSVTIARGSRPTDISEIDREAIASIEPLYASFAAEGEGKAETVREVIERLEEGTLTDDAAVGVLVQEEALGGEAVRKRVVAGYDEGRADAFRLSAILGILMGFYCLTLPRTPPSRGEQRSAVREAMGEVKRQPLVTLFLLAVPISCVHQFYFVHTADFLSQAQAGGGATLTAAINALFGVGGGGLMTIGQMAEILVLALIPLVAKKASRKLLLGIGVAAYALRMALFAYVDSIAGATGLPPIAVLIPAVALHGLCFGCFIFVAFMVVDEETTPDVRASAQSLFNLVIIGIGIIVGSKFAGWVAEWAGGAGNLDYTRLFAVPMWIALGCLAVLLVFYPRKSPKAGDAAVAGPVE